MRTYSQTHDSDDGIEKYPRRSPGTRILCHGLGAVSLCLVMLVSGPARAQVNVLTAHNDIARTGQNLNETNLTPANVNSTQFGKLFSQNVNGIPLAQPLYVSQVTIPGKGVHNVVYVATSADAVYAFDGNDNGGINAFPLWQVSLLTNTAPAGTYALQYGITGTPVINLATNTMYLVSSENQGSNAIYRLHALDITTGAEKFGGPVLIQASVPGTGSASAGGVLTFDAAVQRQRPGLLYLNGVVYIAFGSVNDNGPWHGWLFSFNATTLGKIDVLCTTPNGSGAGIWMGGAGLAAESNPTKPYGRMFLSTGNGSYSASSPYTKTMSYGMSVLDLDLTGGVFTVEDEFTPYNWSLRNAQDADLGAGGPVLLPSQTTTSGTTFSPLVQIGKTGAIYILNRDKLGGFNTSGDQVEQEVQTPITSSQGWGAGIWGSPTYWNGNIYDGGTDPSSKNSLYAYSFVNGVLSVTPSSQTAVQFSYPGASPSISASGTKNGILWVLNHDALELGSGLLLAYDATNLSNLLYSSSFNPSRDYPGSSIEFAVPTVANGRVYASAQGHLAVYGLLGSTATVAPPVISPPGSTFTGSQVVTITDATNGAQIYYTTDGSTPTTGSKHYLGAFSITANTTVKAIASATGYLQGAPVSAVFSSTANAANPVFSLTPGDYTGPQKLTLTDASSNAKIYYTVDGTTPTTASTLYTGTFIVPVGETVQAIATAPGLLPSSVVSATYDIDPVYTIDFRDGFSESQLLGQMRFNGSTDLDDFRLQLTNGQTNEAGSAFYTTPVSIYAFTTDFTFQLSNPVGDGITFTIQNNWPTALGANARDLGYGGIPNSVAIEFNIYNNSTGLAIGGSNPALTTISLANTGINLASGDYMNVHMTYDSQILNMTITDAVTLASWSHAFKISIPFHLGGSSTGYVGFTGGTGGATASQKVTYWTFLAGPPPVPNFLSSFDSSNLQLQGGAAISGTNLQLTNGGKNETTSAYYKVPVDIESFTSTFNFQITPGSSSPLADGFTFVIQNAGLTAQGSGSGGLGYAGIPSSVAVKFDLFNNAGEGNDSTGVYVNGAMPTSAQSTNLSSLVPLGSGDLIQAVITYDGTTLHWYLYDLTNILGQHRASGSMPINIPHDVGSNIAYIGFTAASGDGTAIQNVLNWTFTNP
jgi:hypothetical protein